MEKVNKTTITNEFINALVEPLTQNKEIALIYKIAYVNPETNITTIKLVCVCECDSITKIAAFEDIARTFVILKNILSFHGLAFEYEMTLITELQRRLATEKETALDELSQSETICNRNKRMAKVLKRIQERKRKKTN